MSKTTDKLDEARFFLQQMEANYLEYPAFNYFTSAFISSARSVLWIMRSEYHDIEGWEPWYTSHQPTEDEEVLLKRINAARVRTEKQSPIKTQFRVEISIPKDQATDELKQFFESHINETVRMSSLPSDDSEEIDSRVDGLSARFKYKIVRVYRALDKLADEDILEECKKYYSMLGAIVAECDKRFGPKLAA